MIFLAKNQWVECTLRMDCERLSTANSAMQRLMASNAYPV